jgi:hypothetical protein
MRKTIILTAGIAIAIIILAAVFASSCPDGLEFVAEKLGFLSKVAEKPTVVSPLSDYSIPLIKSPFWSTAFAGVVGAAIVAGLALLIGKFFCHK